MISAASAPIEPHRGAGVNFRKIKKIITGGQAEIWLAIRTDTNEEVVLKYLLPTPQLDNPAPEFLRFCREVRCQSILKHQGIMPTDLHLGNRAGHAMDILSSDRQVDARLLVLGVTTCGRGLG
jgi:hypothetical protein